jgi:hypothetical protein
MDQKSDLSVNMSQELNYCTEQRGSNSISLKVSQVTSLSFATITSATPNSIEGASICITTQNLRRGQNHGGSRRSTQKEHEITHMPGTFPSSNLQENHIFSVRDLQRLCISGSAPNLLKQRNGGVTEENVFENIQLMYLFISLAFFCC